MADLSDAVAGVADLANATLYPGGPGTPSLAGMAVRIVEGWPQPNAIDLALSPSTMGSQEPPSAYVSVFPVPNVTQVTSSAHTDWQQVDLPDPTMTIAVDDNSGFVTILGAGSADLEQSIVFLIGSTGYSIPVAADATPESVAADLAAAVQVDHPEVTVSGAVLFVPANGVLTGRVSRKGTLVRELERERQDLMITVWAPDGASRRVIGSLLRTALADTPHMAMPDGTSALLTYRQTNDSDRHEKVKLYRRDIHYWVEFPTMVSVEGYEVVVPGISMTPG